MSNKKPTLSALIYREGGVSMLRQRSEKKYFKKSLVEWKKILTLWKQNKKPKAMTTIKLTDSEIQEQKNYVAKFHSLINKEISFGDLANIKNIEKYTKALILHLNLIKNPIVEIN